MTSVGEWENNFITEKRIIPSAIFWKRYGGAAFMPTDIAGEEKRTARPERIAILQDPDHRLKNVDLKKTPHSQKTGSSLA